MHPSTNASARDRLPSLRHLRALLLMCEGKSLRAAASEMHVTQPALTLALAGLEAHYGTPLFKRRTSGLESTSASTALSQRVERCLAYLRDMARLASPGADARATERVLNVITIPQIRAVAAISQVRGFTGAAALMGIRAPSVHRSLTELEGILGARLLRRVSGGAELTAVGQDIARLAGLALAELRAATDDVNEVRNVLEGRISIGSVHVSASGIIPAAIIRMSAEFPGATFSVKELDYDVMMEALRSGRLDFICSNVRPQLPPDVMGQQLFESELCIVCRKDHPVLRNGSPSLAELAAYPWVGADASTGAMVRFREMFRNEGLEPPKITVESLLFEVKRALLLGSNFLAVATRAEIIRNHDFDSIEIAMRIAPSGLRPVWLLSRRDWKPTRLQDRFSVTLLEILDDASTARTGAPPQFDITEAGSATCVLPV